MNETNEATTTAAPLRRVPRSKAAIARLRPDDHHRTHQAAGLRDLSVSRYCEEAILLANRQTLEDTQEAC